MTFITIGQAINGIRLAGWEISPDTHAVAGMIVLLTVVFVAALGNAARITQVKLNWKTTVIVYIKIAHKVSNLQSLIASYRLGLISSS